MSHGRVPAPFLVPAEATVGVTSTNALLWMPTAPGFSEQHSEKGRVRKCKLVQGRGQSSLCSVSFRGVNAQISPFYFSMAEVSSLLPSEEGAQGADATDSSVDLTFLCYTHLIEKSPFLLHLGKM